MGKVVYLDRILIKDEKMDGEISKKVDRLQTVYRLLCGRNAYMARNKSMLLAPL